MKTKEIHLTLPGKSFLLGEYSVLQEGPAILATFPPRFELRAVLQANSCPFHPESPAGKIWASDTAFFSQWKLNFLDPHGSAGGFGKSSAEFASLFLLRELQQDPDANRSALAWKARELLRSLMKAEPTIPSAVDVIAQIVDRPRGTLLFVDPAKKLLHDLSGMPKDILLLIAHSGRKQATHEHLRALQAIPAPALAQLNQLTSAAHHLLSAHIQTPVDEYARTSDLGDLFNQYSSQLDALGLVAESTRARLPKIRQIPGVIGAKGCGALGADAFAVLIYRSDRRRFLRAAPELQLGKIFDFQEYKWLETE